LVSSTFEETNLHSLAQVPENLFLYSLQKVSVLSNVQGSNPVFCCFKISNGIIVETHKHNY